MIDKIKSKIAQATERQKVFRLLLHTEEPLMVLKIHGDSEQIGGNIWIKDGERIIAAFVTPSCEDGIAAMLRLLSVKNAEFELADAMLNPQGQTIDLSLHDLVEDEKAMIADLEKQLSGLTPGGSDNEHVEHPQPVGATRPQGDAPAAEGDHSEPGTEAIHAEPDQVEAEELQAFVAALQADQTATAQTEGVVSAPAADANSDEDKGEPVVALQAQGDAPPAQGDQPESEKDNQPEAPSAEPEKPEGKSATRKRRKSEEKDPSFWIKADEKLAALLGDDELSQKRRQEFDALTEFFAEEPSKFYESDEAVKKDADAELHDALATELTEAAKLLSEPAEKFYQESDPERTQDIDLDLFRKRLYESAKEVAGEANERFYETPVALNGPDAMVKSKFVYDPNTDPASTLQEIISNAPEFTESGAAIIQTPEVPRPPESPYADSAAAFATSQAGMMKFAAAPVEESLDLIHRRAAEDGRVVARAPEADFRRKRQLSKTEIMAMVGLVIATVMIFVVRNFYDAKAQEQVAMDREANAMAQRSMEEKSVVAQPQQAFRMPAGGASGSNPNAATQSSNRSEQQSPDDISDAEKNTNFEFKPNANTPTMSAEQQSQANAEIASGDRFAANGLNDQAAASYLSVIRRYPGCAAARARLARLYIAMKKYRSAYEVCTSGFGVCSCQTDFDLLVGIIREIPSK